MAGARDRMMAWRYLVVLCGRDLLPASSYLRADDVALLASNVRMMGLVRPGRLVWTRLAAGLIDPPVVDVDPPPTTP